VEERGEWRERINELKEKVTAREGERRAREANQ